MTKSIVIVLIYFLVFCEIYCNGFSIKLVKIAQDNEVRDLLATDSQVEDQQKVTWEAHVGSWKVKC